MSDSWERLVAQLQERLDDQDTKIAAQDVKIAAQARHSVEQDAQIRHLVTEVARRDRRILTLEEALRANGIPVPQPPEDQT